MYVLEKKNLIFENCNSWLKRLKKKQKQTTMYEEKWVSQ